MPDLPRTWDSPAFLVLPPAAITASVSGPYAPVLTDVLLPATKTPPVSGAWPFMYWNVNYANVYDVVPRAWTLLANLVEPTIGSSAAAGYPSFFADGAILEEGGGNTVGSYAYGLVTNLMAKSGYGAGKTTPYYAQCLIHFPINGTWGNWQKNENYPQGFTPSTPPQSFDTFLDLVPWILDAHLDQYSQALLGYPCLGIDQQVSTG